MKPTFPAILFGAFLGFVTAASAQSFTIDWYTIDGGGGTSSGGSFSLAGSIGQVDAGTMSGGGFSLDGGFWAIVAVQTPGSPLLTIRHTPTNTVVVSWPSTATGFVLQQTVNLNPGLWAAPPETVADDGTNRFIVIHPPGANRFYRLRKP
jgi:hypothetical protein